VKTEDREYLKVTVEFLSRGDCYYEALYKLGFVIDVINIMN